MFHNSIKAVICAYICLVYYVLSQPRCIEESPSNPPTAQCDISFFNLTSDPFNPCICCRTTMMRDDNPPDECRHAIPPTNTKIDFEGTLICNENFDCCSCTHLVCNECKIVQCSGDSSCIGIQSINIDGNCALGGAGVQCNGDVSCLRTVMNGECVTTLDCNGDNSCAQSQISFNLNTPINTLMTLDPIFFIFNGDRSVPFSTINARNVAGFTCGGDNSCNNTNINLECRSETIDKGCKLEVGGDFAAPNSKWDVINSNFISCKGDNACFNSEFNVDCVLGGCPVTMTGDDTAADTIFNINNVLEFGCAGDDSCPRSKYNIFCLNNNDKGCPVSANGDGAARFVDWTFSNANQLTCVGENSCSNSIFKFECIQSTGCPISCSGSCPDSTFLINYSDGVMCNGVILINNDTAIIGACENSIFFLDNNQNSNILCEGAQACKNAHFSNSLSGPVNNIGVVVCGAVEACFGANINIIPSSTAHSLTCNGADSCGNMEYTMTTDLSLIKGIECNGQRACHGGIFHINKVNMNPFTIESYICGNMESCADKQVNINSESNVELGMISCSGSKSCQRMTMNINFLTPSKVPRLVINCNAMESCDQFRINIFDHLAVSIPDIIVQGFDITVFGCPPPSPINCGNAKINGVAFSFFNV